MSTRSFYDYYSASLQILNVGSRMGVARGFASNSLFPIILVSQLRDYLYNKMHFTFKASFAHLIYNLKMSSVGRARGVAGLKRTMEQLHLDCITSDHSYDKESGTMNNLDLALAEGETVCDAGPKLLELRDADAMTNGDIAEWKKKIDMDVTPAGRRKLLNAKWAVDWSPRTFRVFEPLRIVYPLHVMDDGGASEIDNITGYLVSVVEGEEYLVSRSRS